MNTQVGVFGKNIDHLSHLITKILVVMDSFRKILLFKQIFNPNMEISINHAVPQTGKEVYTHEKLTFCENLFTKSSFYTYST